MINPSDDVAQDPARLLALTLTELLDSPPRPAIRSTDPSRSEVAPHPRGDGFVGGSRPPIFQEQSRAE